MAAAEPPVAVVVVAGPPGAVAVEQLVPAVGLLGPVVAPAAVDSRKASDPESLSCRGKVGMS